jgi:hypothetical protein
MLKKISFPLLSFLQVSGLVSYIILLSIFFNYIEEQLPMNSTPYFGFGIMVLIFVISAVFSAFLILGKAGYLFWERRYKESFTIIKWTIVWGILYIALFILMMFSIQYFCPL